MKYIKYFVQLGILTCMINICAYSEVLAGSIVNGNYENIYPGSYGIKIRNNQFSVFYDDNPPEPWKLIPKKAFKAIKLGVFYSNGDKKYYCLTNNKLEKERRRRGTGEAFICKSSGWQY
jgi:hypothetical protein